jgi:hypothetical protein
MGILSFTLPSGLSKEAARDLERACVVGGPDGMPWHTQTRVESGKLILRRDVDESGCLLVPWEVEGVGRVLGSSATLIERLGSYQLPLELARGKINQLRNQAADWAMGGLHVPATLQQHVRNASLAFGKAVTEPSSDLAAKLAQTALAQGYKIAEHLVRLYVEQMFHARHQRQPRLDTTLGCRLGAADANKFNANLFQQTFNAVVLPFSWNEIEPEESSYRWDPYDKLLNWAEHQGLAITGGPLIDFSSARLPDWLWLWERDLGSLNSIMCDYVQTVLKRYSSRIRAWQITAASNCGNVLSLGEDELLWLTAQLVEAARQVDPRLELAVGIAQPWGEYMAAEDRTHSPFFFADTLIRTGLHLASLDIELVMGVSPRGSYFRDLLDTSRIIDLYTLLGLPLRMTLGIPSADSPDPRANPECRVGLGRPHKGYSDTTQSEWAAHYVALALCKPSVRSVAWTHLSDAVPHLMPHCGLFDLQNDPKPAIRKLQELRESHLR